jgi:hypothetical protein
MTLDFPEDVAQAIALLPPRFRPGSDPMRWTLDQLIKVAGKAGWPKGMGDPNSDMPILEWATTLREIRNLLHAGRHALERPHVAVGETQVHDARSMYVMVCGAMDQATEEILPKDLN